MDEVKDRVAVVTGAASGIGRGMAQAFAAAGMKVVLSDIQEEALQVATKELEDAGHDVLAVVTDVGKPESIRALAGEAFAKYGKVHVLCSNAGVGGASGLAWEISDERCCRRHGTSTSIRAGLCAEGRAVGSSKRAHL